VHGSMCDHTAFDPLVAELRDTMTTYAVDRRGFGASGDAAGYALEREFGDVAAVVETVAGRTGDPVALWGHSYGAGCAMGGAALTDAVSRLVLYEPGLGIGYPAGSIEAVEAAVAAGDVETAVRLVLSGSSG
jgi:alpha-beta hydrolase superfamily lysophospholipase